MDTKGPPARSDRWWSVEARTSFPTPTMRTLMLPRATIAMDPMHLLHRRVRDDHAQERRPQVQSSGRLSRRPRRIVIVAGPMATAAPSGTATGMLG